jgi:hypothetical protein
VLLSMIIPSLLFSPIYQFPQIQSSENTTPLGSKGVTRSPLDEESKQGYLLELPSHGRFEALSMEGNLEFLLGICRPEEQVQKKAEGRYITIDGSFLKRGLFIVFKYSLVQK